MAVNFRVKKFLNKAKNPEPPKYLQPNSIYNLEPLFESGAETEKADNNKIKRSVNSVKYYEGNVKVTAWKNFEPTSSNFSYHKELEEFQLLDFKREQRIRLRHIAILKNQCWPTPEELNLDKCEFEALKNAFTRRVALLKGL